MALNLASFLAEFLLIVGGAALFRRMFKAVGQPAIVGELCLGLLLGPSLLGWLWPEAYAQLFPEANRPLLEALAYIGLLIFVCQVGADLHWTRAEAWPILSIAAGGLLVPFVLGVGLAIAAPAWFFPGAPTFDATVLVGLIMAVSAIPILGRVLGDLGLLGHRLGTLSLGAATIDDVVAWTLLGVVAGTGGVGLLGSINLNLLLVALLFVLAVLAERALRPFFARQSSRRNPQFFVWLLLAIFASALVTHLAGLHAVLGPFLVGMLLSQHPRIRDYAKERTDEFNLVLFLPAFFVLAGRDMNLRLLGDTGLVALAVVLAVATVGKVAGAYLGGRAVGVAHRTALETGVLLSTRGAVGLVVATVGREAGFLSATGYTVLAAMVGLTTMVTPIAMGLLRREAGRPAPPGPAAR